MSPINGADHREIKANVGICCFQAAQFVNFSLRALHVRRECRIAGEPQRHVGLHGGVQLGRAAVEDIPAAVGQLPVADIVRELCGFLGFQLAQNVEVENVIGFEGGIGFELAPPVAVLAWAESIQSRLRRMACSTRDSRLRVGTTAVAWPFRCGKSLCAVLLPVSSIPQIYFRSLSAHLEIAAAAGHRRFHLKWTAKPLLSHCLLRCPAEGIRTGRPIALPS